VPVGVGVITEHLRPRDAEDTELVATRIPIHRRCQYQATSRAPKVIRAAESELHLAAFANRLSSRDRGNREGADQKYKQDLDLCRMTRRALASGARPTLVTLLRSVVILSEHTTNSIAPMSTASRMPAILQEAGG